MSDREPGVIRGGAGQTSAFNVKLAKDQDLYNDP